MPAVHPGEILRDDFMKPIEVRACRLAWEIKVARPQVNGILLGRRAVANGTALRLSSHLETTPEFWNNLQFRYDVDLTESKTGNAPRSNTVL